MFRILALVLCLFVSPASTVWAGGGSNPIDIPFSKFVLDNGLTLIVHEDHKAPIVAVNVWYHVGSKNEKPGKSGFAHLFEHLMFNGSENFNDDYFKAIQQVGATGLNGTTNQDRTNYFQNVPSTAVDVALWLESDRMGHMLGAISQARLDEQRGVVQNEKRQGENQPYGKVHELITKATYPMGHPYSWTVIGSMEDLNAATLEDVKAWFKEFYGAANAVVSVAGDITPEVALAKVKKYFGDIPSGPPVAKFRAWPAKRSGIQRQVMEDRVPLARIYMVWNGPEITSPDIDALDAASDVLSLNRNSRLYQRLVYEDQIATSVSAYIAPGEIASQFFVIATARPGESLAKLEKAIREELDLFLEKGPRKKELERAKTAHHARFIRGIERIGGFGGKSDVLASNEVFFGDPGHHKVSQKRFTQATPRWVRDVSRKWLSGGGFILEVHPFPGYQAAAKGVDRSRVPRPGVPPAPKFPKLEQTELSNGLKIILAKRGSIPVVRFALMVDAGFAADQFFVPGTAKLTMSLLDRGTKHYSVRELTDETTRLGAVLSAGADLDQCGVSLSALKENLDPSLAIFADAILYPTFPQEEFDRLKKLQFDSIAREKVTPFSMVLRLLPGVLYGKKHAYGIPFTGTGTEASLAKLSLKDVKSFHQTWFKPNHSTLVVVGDTSLKEIVPKMKRWFGGWKRGKTPKKQVLKVGQAKKARVYLLDRPGSEQAVVLGGYLAPPKTDPADQAFRVANNIYGGSFLSRLNMNLREDKHWSYGARSRILGARVQRPFVSYSSVQIDKTKESLQEMLKELKGVYGERPITQSELADAKKRLTLTLPGSWETMGSIQGLIQTMVRYGLPSDYFETMPVKVKHVTQSEATSAARRLFHPDRMTWMVVGDLKKTEKAVRSLKLGKVSVIDPDGKVIR